MRIAGLAGVLLAGAALGGCATMNTTRIGAGDRGGEGVEYLLPTGQFLIEAREEGGRLVVVLAGPLMVADNGLRMRTRLLSGAASDNDFTVVVGPGGLLSSASGNSEGKVAEVAEALAKTVSGIQGGDKPSGELFFSGAFDFDQADLATREVNGAIAGRIAAACARWDARQPTSRCASLGADVRGNQPFVTVLVNSRGEGADLARAVDLAPARAPGQPRASLCPADALCYHPLAPVRVSLVLANGASAGETYLVPDKTRMSFVRAPAGVFAKQEYDFTFSNGALTSYRRAARNELVGLVTLPFAVVKAVIAAPLELLQARKATADADSALLAAALLRGEGVQKAEQSCAARPDLCTGYAFRRLSIVPSGGDGKE